MQRMDYLKPSTVTALRVTRVGEETAAPRSVVRTSSGEDVTLFAVVRGCATLVTRTNEQSVLAGDVCVAMPFDEIRLRTADEEVTLLEIGVEFEGEWPSCCEGAVVSCDGALSVVEDMRRCATMDAGKTAFLTAKVWEWLALIQENEPIPAVSDKADAVDVALDVIHTRYMENITVSELATMVSLDRSYFYTVFRKKTGVSPQEYLVGYRLDKAAELIRDREVAPSVAANAVGYTDLCQFSKMFKRRFEMSPRAYKNGGFSPVSTKVETPTRIWADEPDVVLL